jgi:hypothetical protein
MTPINAVRYATIAALFLLAGCSRHTPSATVEVIDTSLSITPRAEKAALDAAQAQIGHMQRGDILILIPITGDAANDAGGRALRLSAPTERETYDVDLRRFHVTAEKQFADWVASLDKHQSRTDILGALDAARQELSVLPKESNRRLIVVSDFLEDDGTYNPASLPRVSASSMASRCKACLSALAAWKAATSLRSRRSAKKRSRHSGRRTSLQQVNQRKSNSMARGFLPTRSAAVLAGNDSHRE